jgi:predicted nucleic-acid-binding Zn-ribbon protein
MSDSHKKHIYDHLHKSGVSNFCPACNQNVEWQQAGLMTLIGIKETFLELDPSRGIPILPIICKNCGYIRIFSAKAIGLIK